MKQLTEEQVKKIPEMRNSGMTTDEIAKEFKVSKNSITRWVKILRDKGYEIKRFPRGGRPPLKL